MQHAPAGLGVRIALLYAAIFVVAGTNLPYLPIWLDWAGLSAREIAILTALPLFVRVAVTPIIAFAADRTGSHRGYVVGLSWTALVGLIALAQAAGFWAILLCSLLFALAWTTIMPLTETLAVSGVKRAGLDYGRVRLWGSLSFIAATFLGGLVVDRLGAPSAIWLIIGGGALTALAAHGLRDDPPTASASQRLKIADVLVLLRSRIFIVFLVATGAVQASHAVFYTFGTLHWRSLGLSAGWSGALWSWGVIAEVALFACSRAVLRQLEPMTLITLGSIAAVVRWAAMGVDPAPAWLIVLQTLHGLTYGAAHVGAMHFMARWVPEPQSGTAQALYASVTGGIAMGAAMLAAGPLYAAFGGRAYWGMVLLAAVALGTSVWTARALAAPQPQSPISGG